ncbi:MAG TPA: hypothetical protein VE687_09250 [Stellaceae bacterium]|nr:hypothetical protein [Stellaceae bacterium]
MRKQHPRRYGGRVVHSGDADHPIIVGVVELNTLSTAELDALERFTEARLHATEAMIPAAGADSGDGH